MLTNAPEYHADSVKVSFVQRPPSGAELFLQPPIPGFVKATLRANIELVEEDTPLPRGMRLLTFDVPEGLIYREDDHMVWRGRMAETWKRYIRTSRPLHCGLDVFALLSPLISILDTAIIPRILSIFLLRFHLTEKFIL
jgi:hypothetical protein